MFSVVVVFIFFFKQKTAYEMRISDWSSDVCSSDLLSYAAHTQAALACLNPPGLACMFLDCGGFSNAYQSGIRQGGAFELKQATWAYRQALNSAAAATDRKSVG